VPQRQCMHTTDTHITRQSRATDMYTLRGARNRSANGSLTNRTARRSPPLPTIAQFKLNIKLFVFLVHSYLTPNTAALYVNKAKHCRVNTFSSNI